jgi:hypothetical protein
LDVSLSSLRKEHGSNNPIANAYWLPMLASTVDVDKALDDFKASGMDVLRIWGFADLTSSSGTQTAFQVGFSCASGKD